MVVFSLRICSEQKTVKGFFFTASSLRIFSGPYYKKARTVGDEHLSLAMEGDKLAMEGEQEEGNGPSSGSDVPLRVCVLGYGGWEMGER